MAQTYTRQSTLTDGDTITASLFNNEYNQIVNAFAYSSTDAATTGHRHDGSAAQGGNIPIIGDLNFFNKIVVDGTNNRWGIFVEVAGGPVEQVRIQDGAIVPVTTNDIDLGTGALQFKDIFIDGTANIDSLVLSSGSTVTAILDEDDLVSDSATALATQQSIKAYVDAQVTAQDLDIVGDTGTDAIDLDSETLTFTGGTGITSVVTAGTVTHNIDSTVATLTGTQTLTNKTITSPDINGGTVDGADITVGAAKTLNVSAGTLTLADNQISGDKVEGGTIAAITITAMTGTLQTAAQPNVTSLGTIASLVATTADINGGTIDDTTLGATTPASVAATTISSTGAVTFGGTSTALNYIASNGGFVAKDAVTDAIITVRRTVANTFGAKGAFAFQDSTEKYVASIYSTGAGTDSSGKLIFSNTEDSSAVTSPYGLTQRMTINDNGDISFYEDTGTTAKFFWDASAESLTVPTLSTTGAATIQGLTVGRGAGAVASNTAVGSDALAANTTGANNVANGWNALYSNTEGGSNVANGVQALYLNTTGNSNTANGYQALRSNTTANANTANGYQALRSNTTGGSNTAVGQGALYSNTTGGSNVANGRDALYSNTTGASNVATGYRALYSNTTGTNNTANGYEALFSNTTASNNVAIGQQALRSNTTGANNVANGQQALYSNTTGASNVANGYLALYSNTTADNNTATGYRALYSNTTANNNVANGYEALYFNTTGGSNTAYGFRALFSNTTGGSNVANGREALYSNTTGAFNVATGYRALYSNTTASNNTANGYEALRSNTTGASNVANGYQTLYANTTGTNNTANGYQALFSNTTGGYNTANGVQALFLNTTGNNNTANSYQALYSNTTGTSNVANGYRALYSNTTGSFNTANGVVALYSNTTGLYNTATGLGALYSNTTASYNTANGRDALRLNTTGSDNVANGYQSLYSNTTGGYNVANGVNALYSNTTGENSVANGYQSLYSNTTGGNNTANGYQSLYSNTTGANNTATGLSALRNNTTGVNNTANGFQAHRNNTTGSDNTANGYQALYSNTDGDNNVANGNQALYSNTTGNNNNANGYQSLYSNTTASNNVASGYRALYSNTTGADNTANGHATLFSNTTGNNNVATGYRALRNNTTGGSNVANGFEALYSNTTGNFNTANGYQSLYSNTTGGSNTANGVYALYSHTTGSFNTANGVGALYSNTEGNNNTANGQQALFSNTTGDNNTASGFQTLFSNTTASNSTAIGKDALRLSTTGDNNTAVGFQAGEEITTGAKNTILGSYNGNQGGLDIRTASNHIVLSDGDGNPRAYWDGADATFGGDITTSGSIASGTIDLSPIAATKAVTAVDVFVYDTSLDSDGGAWRKRTQGTSWYNETLNTATRGSRKEFPAVAVIVAEAAKVTIYDGDDPALPMWMVLDTGGGSNNITAVTMLNGVMPVASGSDGSTNKGLWVLYFLKDLTEHYVSTSSSNNGYKNSLSIALPIDVRTDAYIIANNDVNDLAMTVLPDAPVDPATGLPVPTIAVATDGGVSVIKDDGTVVDITTSTSSDEFSKEVTFAQDNELIFTMRRAGDGANAVLVKMPIPNADADIEITDSSQFKSNYGSMGTTDLQTLIGNSVNGYEVYTRDIAGIADNVIAAAILGGREGFSLIAENPITPAKSMHNHLTSSFQTGWMPGNIKGAFLADTDDTDLVGSGELVTNGTFDTDVSGWTVSTYASAIVSDGQLTITTLAGNTNYEQGITGILSDLVIGASYTLSLDYIGGTNRVRFWVTTPSTIQYTNVATSVTFIATTAETSIRFYCDSNTVGSTSIIDNISVKLADEDRSIAKKGLNINGTVTRTPVATGAELVAYSGFSASNYLEQPYNSALDFGTGDFSVMGWMQESAASDWIVDRMEGRDGSSAIWGFNVWQSTQSLRFDVYENNSSTSVTSTTVMGDNNGVWHFFTAVRRSGVLEIYMQGKLEATTSGTARNISYTSTGNPPPLTIGAKNGGSAAWINGKAALIRISATAPTASQIEKIYNDEKLLFQDNAACTIYGASDTVTALAHDPVTDLLHVGTSAGRSVFSGLRRVSNTTTAVGTAISASNGLVVEE